MVERVLQYAAIESGLGMNSRSALAPADIIQGAIDSSMPLLAPDNVQVHRDIALNLPPIMDVVRRAFALVPEYLQTADAERGARNLMDTGIQLGRRFRALKLWMVLREFGATGVREVLARHIGLAQRFAAWVDAHPDFERMAPSPFSVVCFRAHPMAVADDQIDVLNQRVLEEVNRSGQVFLSHTRLNGAFVLRLAIGHLRTTEEHVGRAWELLQRSLASSVLAIRSR